MSPIHSQGVLAIGPDNGQLLIKAWLGRQQAFAKTKTVTIAEEKLGTWILTAIADWLFSEIFILQLSSNNCYYQLAIKQCMGQKLSLLFSMADKSCLASSVMLSGEVHALLATATVYISSCAWALRSKFTPPLIEAVNTPDSPSLLLSGRCPDEHLLGKMFIACKYYWHIYFGENGSNHLPASVINRCGLIFADVNFLLEGVFFLGGGDTSHGAALLSYSW